ncbi:MAG TPA: DUF4340 domain-containing protein [Candidatus Excrementavichristensenella intestinipullorum]|nr:DUF4340 domain-containing protein [Candidatus Excrementavichristensenella intestinipullorum]
MKRSRKVILLVLMLGIVAAGWFGAGQLAQKEAVVETVQAIQVLDGASVTGMSFEASDGPLTLSEQDGAWQMEGDGAFPLDQDQAGEYAQLLASLTATRRITGGAQLADYGLETPAFTVEVTLDGGQQVSLEMGDYNSLTGEYYLKRDDQEDIYTVESSLADLFDIEKTDLARLIDTSDVVTPALLSLEGAFTLETDEDGNWLNGQGQMADQDMAADLTTAVQYLTINRLVGWTGETTLENPLTLTLQDQDGSQIQLLVGQLTQEEDERLIAQADEPQLIYAAPADELEPVLAATDQSLLADQETAQDETAEDETAEDETAGEETAGEEESDAQDGTGGQAASNQDETAGAQTEAEGGTAGGETVQQDAVSE